MSLFKLENVNYKGILSYNNIEISGGMTFICGESGCGKSTLLKLLNGVISPCSGDVCYNDKNILDYEPISLRREVLLVGQATELFNMTIKENFHEYYRYLDLTPVSDEAIQEVLELCCVNLPLESDCSVLSGGEKHRVFIAINLSLFNSTRTKVLMLDEPTSALDDATASSLITNIKSHFDSVIIVSHDRTIANQYADRIITL
jgi:putative ABC transport system ATP-binding protein